MWICVTADCCWKHSHSRNFLRNFQTNKCILMLCPLWVLDLLPSFSYSLCSMATDFRFVFNTLHTIFTRGLQSSKDARPFFFCFAFLDCPKTKNIWNGSIVTRRTHAVLSSTVDDSILFWWRITHSLLTVYNCYRLVIVFESESFVDTKSLDFFFLFASFFIYNGFMLSIRHTRTLL